MSDARLNVVTGAFGYSGRYITRRLLDMGERVMTLTGHPVGRAWQARPGGDGIPALQTTVRVAPFNFDKPDELAKSLEGATTLYNSYWIRFAYRGMTYEKAVANTRVLIKAAQDAGVRRIVHISITNPSEDSPLPYFRGKAEIERAIRESKLTYAILRPAVIYGPDGILINNIAYLVKHFPVFAVLASGEYKLRPIFVQDLAELAVTCGHEDESKVVDAVGPETYTFNELVKLIREKVKGRARIIHVNPWVAYLFSRLIGYVVGDVVLTRDEVVGLLADLLVTDGPPTGQTRLSEWLTQNASTVGAKYQSELARHYRR